MLVVGWSYQCRLQPAGRPAASSLFVWGFSPFLPSFCAEVVGRKSFFCLLQLAVMAYESGRSIPIDLVATTDWSVCVEPMWIALEEETRR